jgi:hypothetical protein
MNTTFNLNVMWMEVQHLMRPPLSLWADVGLMTDHKVEPLSHIALELICSFEEN